MVQKCPLLVIIYKAENVTEEDMWSKKSVSCQHSVYIVFFFSPVQFVILSHSHNVLMIGEKSGEYFGYSLPLL